MTSDLPGSSIESGGLAAIGLGRRLGGKWAVRGASIGLRSGRIAALLGPSGSGKTTLLRLLAGLETPDEGVVERGGQCLSRRGFCLPPERRRIGIVFQDFALFPHMPARENVAFGLNRGRSQAALDYAQDWLNSVGLGDRGDAFPHELSGGEQQRVALARALAPAPSAILLDEPFSGLAPELRAELRERTAGLLRASGAAALIVTHDPDEAQAMADDIAIMHEGRILQIGAPDALYFAPQSVAAAAALGPLNLWRGTVETAAAALGPLPHPNRQTLPAGTPVQVAVRPEGIRLRVEESGPAIVTGRRPQGAMALTTVKLLNEGEPRTLRALLPADQAPALGAPVSVTFDPRLVFVFPAE